MLLNICCCCCRALNIWGKSHTGFTTHTICRENIGMAFLLQNKSTNSEFVRTSVRSNWCVFRVQWGKWSYGLPVGKNTRGSADIIISKHKPMLNILCYVLFAIAYTLRLHNTHTHTQTHKLWAVPSKKMPDNTYSSRAYTWIKNVHMLLSGYAIYPSLPNWTGYHFH